MFTALASGVPFTFSSHNVSRCQARLCLDLDMLKVSSGQTKLPYSRRCRSHNGVVAACALQCLSQLELLRGGR